MLGIIRFVFALMVMVAHVCSNTPYLKHLGVFAVAGFFVISGYLITIILHKSYFFQFKPFAYNRFLRLYPTYLIVALSSALVLYYFPSASNWHDAWKGEPLWEEWLGNLFIFPMPFLTHRFRLVPPIWSVGVEIVSYFLLWLFIARSRGAAILTLGVSLTYHIVSVLTTYRWQHRYFPIHAALLPFSLGAWGYFYQLRLLGLRFIKLPYIITVWIINLVICGYLVANDNLLWFNMGFYINLIIVTLFVLVLATGTYGNKIRNADKFLGDLSYPLFLVHWVVAFVVSTLWFNGKARGVDIFLISIGPALFISIILAQFANLMIEPLRKKVRLYISQPGR